MLRINMDLRDQHLFQSLLKVRIISGSQWDHCLYIKSNSSSSLVCSAEESSSSDQGHSGNHCSCCLDVCDSDGLHRAVDQKVKETLCLDCQKDSSQFVFTLISSSLSGNERLHQKSNSTEDQDTIRRWVNLLMYLLICVCQFLEGEWILSSLCHQLESPEDAYMSLEPKSRCSELTHWMWVSLLLLFIMWMFNIRSYYEYVHFFSRTWRDPVKTQMTLKLRILYIITLTND